MARTIRLVVIALFVVSGCTNSPSSFPTPSASSLYKLEGSTASAIQELPVPADAMLKSHDRQSDPLGTGQESDFEETAVYDLASKVDTEEFHMWFTSLLGTGGAWMAWTPHDPETWDGTHYVWTKEGECLFLSYGSGRLEIQWRRVPLCLQ